jgi:hypothetical protein
MDDLHQQAMSPRREDCATNAEYLTAVSRANADYYRQQYAKNMALREQRDRVMSALGDKDVADAIVAQLDLPKRQRPSIDSMIERYTAKILQRHHLTTMDAKSVNPKDRCSRKHVYLTVA